MPNTPFSAPRHPSRPSIPQRTDTLLPPHEAKSITSIPVTPGISQGTYQRIPGRPAALKTPQSARLEYFAPHQVSESANSAQSQETQTPLKSASSQPQHEGAATSGNVISATFTLPQAIQYSQGGKWVSTGNKLQRIRGGIGLTRSRKYHSKHIISPPTWTRSPIFPPMIVLGIIQSSPGQGRYPALLLTKRPKLRFRCPRPPRSVSSH